MHPSIAPRPLALPRSGLRGTVVAVAVALGGAMCACDRSPVMARYGVRTPIVPDRCERRPHTGVDFRANVGDPVLAAADGVVVSLRHTEMSGGVLLLWHRGFERYMAYVHLAWPDGTPVVGQPIVRGQRIGTIGMYRNSGPTPHVHLELCTAECQWGHPHCTLDGTENPLRIARACFDSDARYPLDRLVLTYPVSC